MIDYWCLFDLLPILHLPSSPFSLFHFFWGQKFVVMCHMEYILLKVPVNSREPVGDQPSVRYVQEYSLSPRYGISR